MRLPSGLDVELRPVQIAELAAALGEIPLPLFALVAPGDSPNLGAATVPASPLRQYKVVARLAIASPLIGEVGDETTITADELSLADLAFIWEAASGLAQYGAVAKDAAAMRLLALTSQIYGGKPSEDLGAKGWAAWQLNLCAMWYAAHKDDTPPPASGSVADKPVTTPRRLFKGKTDSLIRIRQRPSDGQWQRYDPKAGEWRDCKNHLGDPYG
jgi:hypothetical protein